MHHSTSVMDPASNSMMIMFRLLEILTQRVRRLPAVVLSETLFLCHPWAFTLLLAPARQ